MFPKDFVWGAAASAYQIEGTDPEDGRGRCIWDAYVDAGKARDGANAYTACDFMHRYRDDLALMGQLGIRAYRFSISWSRIMPQGRGQVNEAAIQMYRDMIVEMRRHNIEPWLTLYHWELPQALQDEGGWLNPSIVEAFGDYAALVAERFSDLVSHFLTINEPQCFVGLGYLTGLQAPAMRLPMKDTFLIAHNALKAHGLAVKMLRLHGKQPLQIGFAPTCSVAIPATESPADVEAARRVYFGFYQPDSNWTWNVSWFCDPVYLGRYPEEGLRKYAAYLPEITPEDMELIAQPIDFLAQNVYNGYRVMADEHGNPVFLPDPPDLPRTASGWPITPECLYWSLRFLSERYHKCIYVTENGMACHDVVSPDGQVHDPDRIQFLRDYLRQAHRAWQDGVDLRGYFLWTFLDDFEWNAGYSERFGCVYVHFDTLQRIPKDSAWWYKQVIEKNGI